MIVVNAIKATGVKHTNQIFTTNSYSWIYCRFSINFIYVSLGYIGNHMGISQKYDYISNA